MLLIGVVLHRRQKNWQKQVDSRQYLAATGKGGIPRPAIASAEDKNLKYQELKAFTLKELKAYDGQVPAVFSPVVARIVGFSPGRIDECVVLYCEQCHSV